MREQDPEMTPDTVIFLVVLCTTAALFGYGLVAPLLIRIGERFGVFALLVSVVGCAAAEPTNRTVYTEAGMALGQPRYCDWQFHAPDPDMLEATKGAVAQWNAITDCHMTASATNGDVYADVVEYNLEDELDTGECPDSQTDCNFIGWADLSPTGEALGLRIERDVVGTHSEYLESLVAHEIGHLLGAGHPKETQDGSCIMDRQHNVHDLPTICDRDLVTVCALSGCSA